MNPPRPRRLARVLFFGACLGAPWARAAGPLQVPSPDWRDQVVYFAMTDRFDDGDTSNDDQGHGEFDPKDGNFYSGGDLRGLERRLDYIRGLGATAVWITPPVANVWSDPTMKMAGYHGYWAENFKKIDAHLGTLADYRALSAALHGRGMYLIQDVVVNHTGDFFAYDGPYDPARVEKNFALRAGVYPPRPSQWPFSLDDARDPAQRRAAIYHWTPDVTDYGDETQRLTYQVSSLDDLNTENPVVREALRDSYGWWISTAGVDGFRFDTVPYVEHAFYNDFLYSASTSAPGIGVLARSLGKSDFLTFGEVWSNGSPFSDAEEKTLASYLGTAARPELGAVLNFPLLVDLRAVFAKSAPAAQLSYRLDGLNRHLRGGRAAINLVDNQDMARFLAEGSEAGLAQALTVVFTIPGIPLVYAGTEQGFRETRASMFAAGWGSGGRDHFDEKAPLYRLIRELAALRRAEPVFRRGIVVPLGGETAGPGAVAYRLDLGEERALVVLNSSDEEAALAGLDTGLPSAELRPLFARGLAARPLAADAGGRLSLILPPRAILVLKASGRAATAAASAGELTLDALPAGTLSGRVTATGAARGAGPVSLVIDGRSARAIPARRTADGRWSAEFDASALADGVHALAAMSRAETPSFSRTASFPVLVPWTLAKEVVDPVGDDRGPSGTYVYPTSPGFEGRADIEKVALYRRGAAAKLVIKMAHGLSSAWNPPFGFDHVCFHVFIELPELASRGRGASDLPRLHARMPGGAKWNYAAFLGGWKVALYSAEGATKTAFGPQVQPAPAVSASKADGTVEVSFGLDAFKGATSFDGARFYVTTWDYDGVEGTPRALAPKPSDFVFGGGRPDEPRVMDDVEIRP